MAKATSSGRASARNPHSYAIDNLVPKDAVPVHPGLVAHPLVTPGVQVQILSVVDATGSASIGDLIAALPEHADPVGAIFALITNTVLQVITPGIIDAHSIVMRCQRGGEHGGVGGVPGPFGSNGGDTVAIDTLSATMTSILPVGLTSVTAGQLRPQVIVGSGTQRADFGRAADLQRPGVYILLRGHDAYVGYGSNVGARIAAGRQMPEGMPERIITITDADDRLSENDGKALERILWARVAADADFVVVNGLPDGAVVKPERYDQLSLFVGQVALALRQEGFMFQASSARAAIAGPRTETGRLGAPRRLDDLPDGRVMELNYCGLTALAAERKDGSWVLLRGSDVRLETVASANSTAAFQRAAWQHAGLLVPAADNSCYVVMRDLMFSSGSAVSHFVSGSKGFGRAGWRPINADAELTLPLR